MINNISLNNFRQFDNLKLNTNNSLVIISGKNARGKTSILESIFIASTTKSHRENNLENVIKFNEAFSKIEINAEKKYKVVISKDNKNLFINGNEIKKSSDYLGNIDVVMIAPTDISLIRGSKGDKRRFLDLNISILNKKYLNESSKYKKTLNERNILLKSKNIDNLMLDVLTNQLVESIKYIYDSRIYLIDKLNYYLKDISKDMKIESIKLLYEPSYNPDNVIGSFNEKKQLDIKYQATQIGTHRDGFKILINDLEAEKFASEGQSRIIYIAIKLALAKVIKELKGEPIMLLDDIYQALDKDRIASLTSYLKNNKQVFITTTTILEIPDEILKDALVLRV